MRYDNGEFFHADSINIIDSAEFETIGGRKVYGGGGVMPDYFVPLDSAKSGTLYSSLLTKGTLRLFTLDYYIKNRQRLLSTSFEDYISSFEWNLSIQDSLLIYSNHLGIEFAGEDFEESKLWIQTYCRAEIARLVWGGNAYYQLMNPVTNGALEASFSLFSEVGTLSSNN